jgi:hypothetical protein
VAVVVASLAHLINKLPHSLRPGLSSSSSYPFVLVAFFVATVVIAAAVIADIVNVAIAIALTVAIAVTVRVHLQF